MNVRLQKLRDEAESNRKKRIRITEEYRLKMRKLETDFQTIQARLSILERGNGG